MLTAMHHAPNFATAICCWHRFATTSMNRKLLKPFRPQDLVTSVLSEGQKEPGRLWLDYDKGRCLGTGAYGTVHKVTRKGTLEDQACKSISKSGLIADCRRDVCQDRVRQVETVSVSQE